MTDYSRFKPDKKNIEFNKITSVEDLKNEPSMLDKAINEMLTYSFCTNVVNFITKEINNSISESLDLEDLNLEDRLYKAIPSIIEKTYYS